MKRMRECTRFRCTLNALPQKLLWPTDDAEYDSWLLLEPLESPGGEALGGEMEAGTAEEPAADAMEVDAA